MTSRIDADIAQIIAEQDARRAKLDAFCAAGPRTVIMPGGWPPKAPLVLVIHKDSARPGKWRITRFEGDEPIGHTEPETWKDAVKIAVEDWRGRLDLAEEPDMKPNPSPYRVVIDEPAGDVVERRVVACDRREQALHVVDTEKSVLKGMRGARIALTVRDPKSGWTPLVEWERRAGGQWRTVPR